jgi:hypothetical protein
MATTLQIPISALLVDDKNPRLPQPNLGQRAAQRAIAQDQQKKLLKLAEDIVAFGLNLAELPIVMQQKDDLHRYVVLEGNRRLVALRALENPEWLIGVFNAALLTRMRDLSRAYLQNPIESTLCLIVKDRDEARHSIELRHSGSQLEGAGIVPWGADESARFRARSGGLRLHSQVLDFLERRDELTPEERSKIPTASLRRLLETPDVASRLGIAFRDGQMVLLASEAQVAKAVKHVIYDLVRPDKKRLATKDIYTKDQRVAYIEKLPPSILVKKSPKKSAAVKPVKLTVVAKPVVVVRKPAPRDYLIPTDCVMAITDQKLLDIERELRGLSLENYTNAVSVLFRVFIELCCDSYITRLGLQGDILKDKLSKKMKDVADDLQARSQLSESQARPVRHAAAKDVYVAGSISSLNEYVHNLNEFPQPTDLRNGWNSLQAFLKAVWSV